VTAPAGTHPAYGGEEVGYLKLANGYIKIMGYRDTPNELPAAFPALEAIKFEAAR
jgi:hypothetical protein